MIYKDCPACGAEVELASYEKMKFCSDCGKLLELDADAEFYPPHISFIPNESKLVERKPEVEQ